MVLSLEMNANFFHRSLSFPAAAGCALIFFIGIYLDCRTVLPLFSDFAHGEISFRQLFIGHAAANLITAFALLWFLPPTYRRNSYKSYICCFSLVFFTPILGTVGLLAAIIFGLREEQNINLNTQMWQATGLAPMPIRAPKNIQAKTNFDANGMQSRLRKSDNFNEHLDIVLATRFMRDENAIPLLNMALRDPQDDVRLLAFSLLEKKNAEINTAIEGLQLRLVTEDKKAKIHIAIAQNHLRLVRLELIQEEIKKQALTKARRHLNEALGEDPLDRTGYFVLGQVLLEQAEVEQAESAFAKALELGFADGEVYPFLAKTAYLRRQFHKISDYLKKIPEEHLKYPPLADIGTYWLHNKA